MNDTTNPRSIVAGRRSALTTQAALQLRQDYLAGATWAVLQVRYGASVNTIARVLHGTHVALRHLSEQDLAQASEPGALQTHQEARLATQTTSPMSGQGPEVPTRPGAS